MRSKKFEYAEVTVILFIDNELMSGTTWFYNGVIKDFRKGDESYDECLLLIEGYCNKKGFILYGCI